MKESTKIRLFALAAALTLTMFGCVFGQVVSVNRFENRPDIKTLMPKEPVEFGYTLGSPDNLKVGILKDVISKDSSSIKLYAYLPKGKNAKDYEFVLKFADGNFYKFDITKVYPELNMAEYEVLPDGLLELRGVSIEGVMIRYNGDVYVGGFSDTAYFQNFLQVCKN